MAERAPVQETKWHRRIGVLLLLLVVLGMFGYAAWVNLSNGNNRVEFVDR